MKYHYQHVSATTVRIELIAEDQKENSLIQELTVAGKDHPELVKLFSEAVQAYMPEATLIKISYMNFPRVALCSFNKVTQEKTQEVA